MDIICPQESDCSLPQLDTEPMVQCNEETPLTEIIDLDPDNESDENKQSQEDIEVEEILKGILKRPRSWNGKNKKVNWDLKLRYIPWDEEKDYTIEIEIVKEIPKKIVSYREMYRKMAEEKAEAERKASAALCEDLDDDEEEEEDDIDIGEIKFGKLKVNEPGKDGRIRSPAPSIDIFLEDEQKNEPTETSGVQEPLEDSLVAFPNIQAPVSIVQSNEIIPEPLFKPIVIEDNTLPSSYIPDINTQPPEYNLVKSIDSSSSFQDPLEAQIFVTGPDSGIPVAAEIPDAPIEDPSLRGTHIMDAKMVPDASSFVRVEPRLRLASISEETELDPSPSEHMLNSYLETLDNDVDDNMTDSMTV